MRISKYKTILEDDGTVNLMKESSHNYGGENCLNSPAVVYNLCHDFLEMHRMPEEYVYIFSLNNKNKLIGFAEISHGTYNASVCNTREVFQKALLMNAVRIIIVHNHPSGDCTPSAEDIKLFGRLKSAGELMGIPLADSVIIGGNSYVSMLEQGY